MSTTIENLPFFSGFYNTVHDIAVDRNFSIGDYADSVEESERIMDELTSEDYRTFMTEYSKRYFDAFVDEFSDILKAKNWTISFKNLYSPKEYNYINDQIRIELTGENTKEFDNFFTQYEVDNKAKYPDGIDTYLYYLCCYVGNLVIGRGAMFRNSFQTSLSGNTKMSKKSFRGRYSSESEVS